MNRRGSEHLDASHGLEVLCRARMFEVHVLPILSYRPSLYCFMSPLLFSLLILILACVACMFLQRPSLNNFLSPLQSSWSVLSLLVFLVLAHARLFNCFLLSPLSSPSVLLLACVAHPQQPPVSLLFAVAASFSPLLSCIARPQPPTVSLGKSC